MSNTEEKIPQAAAAATDVTEVEETKEVEADTETSQSQDNTTAASSAQSQAPKKSKYLKLGFKYCKDYDDINKVVKSFPALNSLLTPPDLENTPSALCYVIRSNNDDDVHKAIKYGIWTSVPGNNVKLNQAWENAQKLGVEVYLFFSVVKSGQFNGVARLKSSFQDETFSYWWQPHKFKGHFKVEWVFVKDVKQKQFEGLKNCQNDDISRSKDCTELNYESTGKKMLQIFSEAPSKPSIFDAFKFFDQYEKGVRRHYSLGNQMNMNNWNRNMAQDNAHLPPNSVPNPNGFFYHQQYQLPYYQKKMLDQQQMQFMQNMGMMQQQQFTHDQYVSLQNLCETHIYPPNTSFQLHQQNHHSNGNGKSYNNHNGNNSNSSHRRNHNNNNRKNHHNNKSEKPQQQLPTPEELPQLESLKAPVKEATQ